METPEECQCFYFLHVSEVVLVDAAVPEFVSTFIFQGNLFHLVCGEVHD